MDSTVDSVGRRAQRLRILPYIVGAALVAYAPHYIDMLARFDTWTDTNPTGALAKVTVPATSWITAPVIAIAGIVCIAAALWGVRSALNGERSKAIVGLVIASLGGLVMPEHLTKMPLGHLDGFQIFGLASAFIGGLTLLGSAVWVASDLPA